MAVKRICCYLQDTKYNGLLFNTPKKLVLDCYADADFLGLLGHENPQEPICARSRTGFVVTFYNCLYVGIASICASFDNLLLFSLRRTGTLRAHSCCFLLLMKL